MRAKKGALPKTKGWAFETEMVRRSGDGDQRARAHHDHGRDRNDISRAFPEIRRIGRALGAEEVILDGVIMCDAGRDALERRLAAKSDSTIRRIARDQPALFVAFDLIWQAGRERWDEPWTDRRERLDGLELKGDNWQVPALTSATVPSSSRRHAQEAWAG